MPNRLAHEKSPYLLQHALNPVDWYPWGNDAFSKAREEDKPIFLSVGYSTCHWCHVMERESFENVEIAGLLNTSFVCIKVDREERPDIDRLYMSATQAMTGSGGWPMSVFLTPDLKPFFAGTYYPPVSFPGRPGFVDVLEAVRKSWHAQRTIIVQSAEEIVRYMNTHLASKSESASIPDDLSATTFHQIASNFDAAYGGFGQAPKFPRPVTYNFLLRHHYKTGEASALEMTLSTKK